MSGSVNMLWEDEARERPRQVWQLLDIGQPMDALR